MTRRCNAKNVMWEKVEVLGKTALFSSIRVDRDTIPDGWYFYEVRHADNDWCEPIEIALGVLVNHFGTLIMKEPLPLVDGYLELDSSDWKYLWTNLFQVEGSQ